MVKVGVDRTVLSAQGLSVDYHISRGLGKKEVLPALRPLELTLRSGESLGVLGESGSGKSTLLRALVGGGAPNLKGRVCLDGQEVTGMAPKERRRYVAARVGFVFQDPRTSLNPSMTVEQTLEYPLRVKRWGSSAARSKRVAELLELVDLPRGLSRRYPSQISGGQRQRVAIARALALDPLVLLADEPTSSLDVSVGSQVLDLLARLKTQQDLAMVVVSHDVRALIRLSDTLLVMYAGYVVERGSVSAVWDCPTHPYSRRLFDAVPSLTRHSKPESAGPREAKIPET